MIPRCTFLVEMRSDFSIFKPSLEQSHIKCSKSAGLMQNRRHCNLFQPSLPKSHQENNEWGLNCSACHLGIIHSVCRLNSVKKFGHLCATICLLKILTSFLQADHGNNVTNVSVNLLELTTSHTCNQ